MDQNPLEPLAAIAGTGHAPSPPHYGLSDQDTEEARIPLSQYLWILRRYRWRILAFCMVSVMVTLVISARLTPIYESIATVDIDRQTPPDVVGRDAARNALNDADQFLATQMKLVQSDSVLRPVDQQLHLREVEGQFQASGSVRAEAAPVTLARLRVTRPPNTYLMSIAYRSQDPQLAADAANAITQSYLEQTYDLRIRSAASLSKFMQRQLEELRGKMETSSRALSAFERELNVISPEEKINILGSRLLQLNTDYTAAEGERLRKQAAYDSVRDGSIEAALATPQGEALRKLAEHLTEARERFAEVQSFYGENHPEYQRAQARLKEVEAGLEATQKDTAQRVEIEFRESQRREEMAHEAMSGAKDEFDRVNARSFEYQSVKQEADADKNLYEELVRKIKEAGINAGFQNNAVRIADLARAALEPVSPNLPLNGLLALLFSAVLAVSGAVLSDVLDKTVRDPEQVARTLHAEVIGSLPLMKNRRSIQLASPDGRPETRGGVGAGVIQEQETSGFGESVRTLRNSILLASFDRRYRSLLVTSAAPSEGKTTTAANLAAAHARQGQRTLLIDGDLRRPSVHRNFNLASALGLSNVLLGEVAWRAAVLPVAGLPELHVLAAGPPGHRASDLIERGLAALIEEASGEYDLVVLDGPPLLGFAEPLQMATAVDGVIVVACAGQTSRRAVATVLATLNRVRAKVVGLVLNQVHRELSDSYGYYGYYRSYYQARTFEQQPGGSS